MKRKNLHVALAVMLVMGQLVTQGLLAGTAEAADIVIDLQGVNATQCGESWVEDGVTLSFVETTSEDCDGGGSCFFGIEPDYVWLFPARLDLDFSGLTCTVTDVEVDIEDYCGAGCTKAFLYRAGSTADSVRNQLVGTPETLNLSSGGTSVDSMAVSSCEGLVSEIRITCEDIPPWGTPASVIGARHKPTSDIANLLFLVALPMGAVFLLRIWRRRR